MSERDSLLLLDKSFDKIMAETIAELETTVINNSGPGGVARLILAKVNKQLATFYERLELKHAEAFLSKAKEGSLDLIGPLLNCERRENESDTDYKYRISQQSLTLEKANETAVRLAALSVAGVKDVVLRPFTHGTGSFSVYVVTDESDPSDNLILKVSEAVQEVRGFGTRSEVFKPRLAPVELRMRLSFDEKTGNIDKTVVNNRAIQFVRTYINTLKPGEVLSIQELKTQVMRLSESILHVEVYHFTIKGRPMLLVNQKSAWNERFIESLNPGAILVS